MLITKLLKIFSKTFFLVVLSALFSLSYVCVYSDAISPIIFTILLFLIGTVVLAVLFRRNRRKPSNAFKLFSYVFFLNVLFVCLIYSYYIHVYGSPYEYGGTDDKYFEDAAYAVIESGSGTIADKKAVIAAGSGSWHAGDYYVFVVAVIHKAFLLVGMKPHTLNPRLFNSFCLALISIIVWQLSLKIGCSKRASLFAGYFCGLFPHMIFESAHIYRDTIISLGVISSIFLYVSLLQPRSNNKLSKILMLILLVIFTSALRNGFLIIFSLIFISIFYYRLHGGISRIAILGTLILIFVTIIFSLNIPVSQVVFDEVKKYYTTYTLYRVNQGEVGGIGVKVFALPMVWSVPLRIIYGSLSPVPFPTGLLSENYHRLGTIIWFFSLPFLLWTLWSIFKVNHNIYGFSLRSVAVSFIILYLIVSIITLQDRQNLMYIPLAIPLIVYGIERSRETIGVSISKMVFLALGLSSLYVIVKFC